MDKRDHGSDDVTGECGRVGNEHIDVGATGVMGDEVAMYVMWWRRCGDREGSVM